MTYIKTAWELCSRLDRNPTQKWAPRRFSWPPMTIEQKIEINRFREKHGIQVKKSRDLTMVALRLNKRSRKRVTLPKVRET